MSTMWESNCSLCFYYEEDYLFFIYMYFLGNFFSLLL